MIAINPFDHDLLWADCQQFELPFHFGGATQRGRLTQHTNNQDALAIWAHGRCVVAAVCDGCSTSERGFSNNEVGARLISQAIVSLIGEHCKGTAVASIKEWLPVIEQQLGAKLLRIADVLLAAEYREEILHNLMMSTVLACAVDGDDFAVFGCGDGAYAINGKTASLDEFSGRYLAGRLLTDPGWASRAEKGDGVMRVHQSGRTSDLQTLLLASDGFEQLQHALPKQINEFVASKGRGYSGSGYAEWMVVDFRSRVWNAADVRSWAETQDSHDDRTFIVIRRDEPTVHTKRKEGSPCSTSNQTPSRVAEDS